VDATDTAVWPAPDIISLPRHFVLGAVKGNDGEIFQPGAFTLSEKHGHPHQVPFTFRTSTLLHMQRS
jgi:hypothetical protein